MEALSEIRDGSTCEVTQGYLTIDAAVLSEKGKMPLPVYEKVFSAAEKGFISETYENLCCLESLSENFTSKCVRTLDRGFDANDYYRYFLKHGERFVIRAKRTGMSFMTGSPVISWMWHYGIKELTAWILRIKEAGKEKAVPHHYQGISALVADRGIFPVQETTV